MTNTLNFSKMHGLGNDFMVIDGVNQSIQLSASDIQAFSDRHRGIGFDQLLLVGPSKIAGVDFSYTIFNADGTESGQCGNGARCVARFIHEKKLSTKKKLTLETKTSHVVVEIHDDHYQRITAQLGVPSIIPEEQLLQFHAFHSIDVGNPHAIMRVDDISVIPVHEIGTFFNKSTYFPKGVNVEWMQIDRPNKLKLRVFERGTGETQACGSGACAAMICARKFYGADSTMDVELPGGILSIHWEGEGQPVSVTGSAVHVFDGVL
jgi:diaminopimelate epimerase